MRLLIFLISVFFFSTYSFSEQPTDSQISPEDTILFWNKYEKLSGFKNGYKFVPSRVISKSSEPYPLNYLLLDFSKINYKYKGKTYTLQDYINKFNVAGMMVVRRGNILY